MGAHVTRSAAGRAAPSTRTDRAAGGVGRPAPWPPAHPPSGRRRRAALRQPALAGVEPLPPAARPQPGRLAPLGRRGVRRGAGAGRPRLPFRRLFHLPLVPRDGGGIVRGPRDRRDAQPALRARQGRPRGAPRRGHRLHAGGAAPHPARRLADERLPHARSQAVLRRDLLPSPRRRARSPGRVPHLAHGAAPDLCAGARARGGGCRADLARRPGKPRARSAHRGARASRLAWRDVLLRRGVRPGRGRRAARAQVSLQPAHAVPAPLRAPHGRRAGLAHGHADAPEDGAGRHLRSGGRRVPPLLDRRPLAGAALREDALRQRPAGPGVRRSLAVDGRRLLPRDRHGRVGLRGARDDRSRRRVLVRH